MIFFFEFCHVVCRVMRVLRGDHDDLCPSVFWCRCLSCGVDVDVDWLVEIVVNIVGDRRYRHDFHYRCRHCLRH